MDYYLISCYIFVADETSDILKHLVCNSKLHDDLFELNVETKSSYVGTNAILNNYTFDSNSVFENM